MLLRVKSAAVGLAVAAAGRAVWRARQAAAAAIRAAAAVAAAERAAVDATEHAAAEHAAAEHAAVDAAAELAAVFAVNGGELHRCCGPACGGSRVRHLRGQPRQHRKLRHSRTKLCGVASPLGGIH